ncbi:MAG TPA: Bax inhibitor-1 family protein [Rhodothermales bacterium]|nr:Bax inhibitor-1 family protein [Rhodothermales bacterium]
METYDRSLSASAQGTLSASRQQFLVRTYSHLIGAILLFMAIEVGLFMSGLAYPMAVSMLSVNWLLVLGGFVVAGWLARSAASRATSMPAQYAALALYVVAEAIIFVPLLVLANQFAIQRGSNIISSAAWVTLLGFAGLSAVVFMTRKDFSFLGGIIRWAGIVALVLIVAGAIFGFELGTFFSVGMIALAGAAILYDTSNVLHHYPEDRYVGAALELFASVALMFWYVLRLFMSRR